jgi:hypothetical protein
MYIKLNNDKFKLNCKILKILQRLSADKKYEYYKLVFLLFTDYQEAVKNKVYMKNLKKTASVFPCTKLKYVSIIYIKELKILEEKDLNKISTEIINGFYNELNNKSNNIDDESKIVLYVYRKK